MKSFGLRRHAPNHFFVKNRVPGSRQEPGPILGAILDAFLGTFWEPLGPPWAPLGSLWVPFGLPWGPLAPLGALWAHLGPYFDGFGSPWVFLGLVFGVPAWPLGSNSMFLLYFGGL